MGDTIGILVTLRYQSPSSSQWEARTQSRFQNIELAEISGYIHLKG
jgi:hypothetical protein